MFEASLRFFAQFIFSTALDGKIKAWLFDNLGPRVDYDAPGRWCTTMAYSADGTRLLTPLLLQLIASLVLDFCSLTVHVKNKHDLSIFSYFM